MFNFYIPKSILHYKQFNPKYRFKQNINMLDN